jgi:hypothetical protein
MAKFDNHMIFRIVLIVLAAFVLFGLIQYYKSKQQNAKVEKFYAEAVKKAQANDGTPERAFDSPLLVNDDQDAKVSGQGRPQPSEELENEVYRTVDYAQQQKVPSDCFPKDRLTADDLLPKDAANLKWSSVSPSGQGSLSDVNLLSAGHSIGISTISGTLRNANLQLRSEPPNPQMNVGPWSQTTISPDPWRRPLEIVGDC